MKKNYLFLLLAFFCLAFTSCGDDDEPTPDTRSLLVNKNWIYTAYTATDGTRTEDYFNNAEPCNQDDIWRFEDNGYYQMNEGATKCDATYAQIYETGIWELTGNTLTIINSGNELVCTIEEISTTTLKLNFTQQSQGLRIKYNLTFSNQ